MNGAMLLPEFDHEFAQTRRTLERVPADRFAWRPHEKSYSLRDLAGHLAQVPGWLPVTLDTAELDMDTASFDPFDPTSTEEILDRFDAAVASARAALADASPEQLAETWSLKAGGSVAFSMPKAAVLRSFVFNHNVHHRAQLGVYLRLLDVPVPSIYGPSADEQG
jgi:uncharacterized damage-inducible protein DinB